MVPNVDFNLTITITSDVIIIDGVFSDNTPVNPVVRFYITINGDTYTISTSGFPLNINITEFTAGQSYTVTVTAENIIGNTTVATQSFNIPCKYICISVIYNYMYTQDFMF